MKKADKAVAGIGLLWAIGAIVLIGTQSPEPAPAPQYSCGKAIDVLKHPDSIRICPS